MQRLRTPWGMIVAGGFCFALTAANITVLSLLSAVVAVVALPAVASARYAPRGPSGDLLERTAYAYGGLGLSCWSLWLAGLSVGLHRWSIAVAPVLVAALLAAAAPKIESPSTECHPAGFGGEALSREDSRRCHVAVWLTALLMAVVVTIPFLPYGWQAADGVHRMGMHDWYKHLMVTTALRDPVFPPSNPFLLADAQAPYYYGFHLIGASVHRLSGGLTDLYVVLLGLVMATAAAFPILLFVLGRGLLGSAREAAVAAVGGTLLVGFDLVVWVAHAVRDIVVAWPIGAGAAAVRAVVPSSHLDFWIHHNERQFSAPYLTAIWAPQHLAAVLLALLIIHLLRPKIGTPRLSERLLPAVLLAVLPAISAYVALALFVGVAATVGEEAVRRGCAPWRASAFRRWATVGVPAAALASPVLWILAGASSGQLTVAVSSAGSWLNGAVFSAVLGDGWLPRLLDTPVLYVVEFGVVGLLGVKAIVGRIRRGELWPAQRQALVILTAVAVLVVVVRPPEGGPNNLYARPLLLTWSLLAVFAATDWCAARRRWMLRRLAASVCAGGTLLAVAGATAEGALFWSSPRELVEAARWINTQTAPNTVVALGLPPSQVGYWLRRRVVAADRRHAMLFGATSEQYDDTMAQLAVALDAADPVQASELLGRVGADVVVIDQPRPPWARPPCFEVGFEGEHYAVVTRS